jgi:hypothetical protein
VWFRERVIKLEEQARVWRLAAVESRPTEGAAPPSDLYRAPAHVVPQSAYKRVSYLAEDSGEATCLMTVTISNPFARTPLAG